MIRFDWVLYVDIVEQQPGNVIYVQGCAAYHTYLHKLVRVFDSLRTFAGMEFTLIKEAVLFKGTAITLNIASAVTTTILV